MHSLSQTLISFSRDTVLAQVPADTLRILKLSLLDWISVALAGADEPASRIIRDMLTRESGTPEAFVFGQNTRLPVRAAALANGTTSHALDYDDTHFLHIGHPAVAIFPAALALAEKQAANGTEFLTAALVGVESSCRIGHWFGRTHYEAGFHQTATAGTFGATLAGARLLALSGSQTGSALGLAATRASGLKRQFGTMGKPYNAGMAASNGVEVALLAQAGFTSDPEALEADFGFADTHAATRTDEALHRLGEEFVLKQVQHKFHACCHGLHAALEALNLLLSDDQHSPGTLAKIEIKTHFRWLKVCNIPHPATGLEAKFSYRQTAAMRLTGIDTGALGSFDDSLCADPELAALRQKITVSGAPELSDTQAEVTLHYQATPPRTARFDLAEPRPLQERQKRVLKKSATLLGAAKSAALWQEISRLEQAETVNKLIQTIAKN